MTINSQATLVSDKAGRQYELTCSEMDSLLIVHLHRSGEEVGTARCIIDADAILLCDLEICDGRDLNWVQRLMRQLSGKPVTYQCLGLGTAILRTVIQNARDKELRAIYGSVTQTDLDNNPHLLTWYQQHGFQIEEPTEQEIESAIARIHLSI
ncbi:MAG: hypothetical protein EA367_13365 [Leptolyngbya sp. DLM2.Bin15]|nr:MAG: hypothetical protein EA367_13365 [Leptolyngbya sp. DLM2.Bin15]